MKLIVIFILTTFCSMCNKINQTDFFTSSYLMEYENSTLLGVIKKNLFPYSDIPIVLSYDDIERYENKIVYVIGTYEERDIYRRKKSQPKVFIGHVGIRLLDNKIVYLYPSSEKESIRSTNEIGEFKDKLVRVKGSILSYIPKSIIDAPCLTEVLDIEMVP